MGYTHYFKQEKPVSDAQWAAFKHDAQIVIDHAQKELGIVLISNDSNGIILNDERINLNGDESRDLDHETFFMEKDYRDFNFCKTARKPYDLVVCSLLLLAHKHMPNHHDIGSDGNFEEWQDAMVLNAALFGYAFKLPERIDNSSEVTEFEDELAHSVAQKQVSSTTPSVDNNTKTTHNKHSRFNL